MRMIAEPKQYKMFDVQDIQNELEELTDNEAEMLNRGERE